MSLVRRAPKRFSALVFVLAAAIIVPAAAFAWGPNRTVFDGATPATYPVFNSMLKNPQVGDERNFVRIRESGTSEYINQVTFQPGKVYDVSVYFHNNAASNLNESGKGQAKDATLKMEVPNVVKGGVNAALTGTISASNTNPLTVWDEAYGKNATNADVALRYVAGSATFVSHGAINGQKLPDSLFTTGAKLGYNAQDGVVPGCNEYSGFVNFKIRVDQPNFNVQKVVSIDDGKTWVETAKVAPGSTVLYGISYQNTGTNQQDNVSVRDILPNGVSYVAGSTYLMNSVTGGEFKKASDGITTVGYNAGSYQPKGNVFFKFSAKVPGKDALKCGANTFVNTARVTTNAGYKEDTATVTVDKTCEPPKPVAKYTCKSLGITTVDRTNFKFATNYTAENATFKSVTYVIKNAAGQIVDTKTATSTTLNYTQATAGKYTVQATVTFTVNGQDKTASGDCKGAFEVKETPQPPVKDIKACDLKSKKIITIKEDQFDSSKHSKNLNDCKEAPKEHCPIPGKENLPKDSPDCKEAPVTPPELPHTGAGENVVAVVGLGALIASIGYYVASRRALGL